MRSRAAPLGAVLCLALIGVGTCHALSLRSSAAEAFLGDVSPGTTVVYSRATGARLRVENAGPETVQVEFKSASPPRERLKDGYDPWPYPDRVRLAPGRTELDVGQGVETDLSIEAPRDRLPSGQYQFDVLATAKDRAGGSLTLKTRVLLSVGAPLARARDVPDGGWALMPGFSLSPPSAMGPEAVVKIVNAGDEDVTVTLSPARDWDDSVRTWEGEEPAPNPRWLKLEPNAVKLRAGAIGAARVRASVPHEKRYAGRRWDFVAAVDAEAGGRRTRRYFVLRVSTPEWKEEAPVR